MTPLARTLAYGLGLSRVVIGSAAVLAPGRAMNFWLGVDPEPKSVKAMGIAIGARDLALGVGTLVALSRDRGSAVWLQVGVLADAADALATVRAFSADLRNPRMAVAAAGACGAAVGAWLAQQASD
jgi:hypothetical protein